MRFMRVPDQPARTAPPLTLRISPEMKPASGVQRNNIGPAISLTCPGRPRGMVERMVLERSGCLRTSEDISVATQPGATQLQEIPWAMSSEERDLVRLMRAPLLAA